MLRSLPFLTLIPVWTAAGLLSSVMAFSPACLHNIHHTIHLHQRGASLSTAHLLRLEEPRCWTLGTDRRKLQRHTSALFAQEMEGEDDDAPTPESSIWMPQLRRIMASIATAGALETAYLSYTKLVLGESSPLCGVDGSCSSVLSGPYSNIPFTDIPLALLGCLAYVTVGVLWPSLLFFFPMTTMHIMTILLIAWP